MGIGRTLAGAKPALLLTLVILPVVAIGNVTANDAVREEWVQRYDAGEFPFPRMAIGHDAYGAVYVTGTTSRGAGQYSITIKYDADGNELWAHRLDRFPFTVTAHAMAVDPIRSDAYIVGSISGGRIQIAKFNTDGDLEWFQIVEEFRSFATGVVVDPNGDVYVAGTTDNHAWLGKRRGSDGAEIWTAREAGGGGLFAIALDSAANVYAAGWSGPTPANSDMFTISRDADGKLRWRRSYAVPGDSNDQAHGIVIGLDSYVFVTGYTRGETTGDDYTTLAYDLDGKALWAARRDFSLAPGSHDYPSGIAFNEGGQVSVTGEGTSQTGTGRTYATVAYDLEGNELWMRRYSGGATVPRDAAKAIAVDASGRTYVTGESLNTGGRFLDYATVAYDKDGTQLWAIRYDGPSRDDDGARALTVGDDAIYVTGVSRIPPLSNRYTTIKYVPVKPERP